MSESVSAELLRYVPADAAESRHRDAFLDLIALPADVSVRHYYVPGHLTASCFIVDPAERKLLLHHHRRLGRWLQMGGHIEPGEHPSVAALREGEEESGLGDLVLRTAIFDLDIHEIPAGKGEPPHLHYDIRYVASTLTPDAIKADPAESSALAWFSFEEAIPLMNEEASARAVGKIAAILGRS